MRRLLRTVACCIAVGLTTHVAAQGFPEKSIRFMVPFPPGGGTDTFARIVGGKLTEMWGQQVIVDNRPGAQGNIGTAIGAKVAANGYTITLAFVGTLAINLHLYANPGFDTLRDFTAISRGTEESWLLVVHPSLPVKTAKDLAALATIDLVAGNVHLMFPNPAGPLPHIRTGRLRALKVLGPKRIEELPDVVTAVEAGHPELNLTGWYGVVAPAATPRDVVMKLNAGVVDALNSPDVVKRMRGAGQHPSPSTPEEFNEQMRADIERWGKIVKATGAKVE